MLKFEEDEHVTVVVVASVAAVRVISEEFNDEFDLQDEWEEGLV